MDYASTLWLQDKTFQRKNRARHISLQSRGKAHVWVIAWAFSERNHRFSFDACRKNLLKETPRGSVDPRGETVSRAQSVAHETHSSRPGKAFRSQSGTLKRVVRLCSSKWATLMNSLAEKVLFEVASVKWAIRHLAFDGLHCRPSPGIGNPR